MYFVKTPWWLKKLYPQLVWNKARNTKTIFLTFDDGPIPIVTPAVLKILKTYNAKATFFCIGDNIIKHPDVFLQLKADGHTIGNHTFNHLKGWATANDVYIANFEKCQNLTQTNFFRPPYGRIKRSQILEIQNSKVKIQNLDNVENEKLQIQNSKAKIQNLDNVENEKLQIQNSKVKIQNLDNVENEKLQSENLKAKIQNLDTVFNQTETLNILSEKSKIKNQKSQIIMWDVLSGDFDTTLTPQKCLKNVLKHTENGSIVVFHDSLKAWDRLQYVLPQALAYWQKQGYRFEGI
jgi:peptidoglycan-N-acetylglucosamine deacetylase